MRSFHSIAKLIKTKRLNHPKSYSQSELSNILGYKNGQFISNVERALCNIPLKMLNKVAEVLDISKDDLKKAILEDEAKTLDNYLKMTSDVRPNESKKRAADEVYKDDLGVNQASSLRQYGS